MIVVDQDTAADLAGDRFNNGEQDSRQIGIGYFPMMWKKTIS